MITFFFSGPPYDGRAFQWKFDTLRSRNCRASDLTKTLYLNGEKLTIVAEFDDSHAPWLLVSDMWWGGHEHAPIAELRKMRADFPQFFIGRNGCIIDSDLPRGLRTVMMGPDATNPYER